MGSESEFDTKDVEIEELATVDCVILILLLSVFELSSTSVPFPVVIPVPDCPMFFRM